MEELFIMVPLLVFMAILYRWMCRLDEYCGVRSEAGQDSEYLWKDVLLFGSDPALCEELRTRRLECDVVACPAFPLLRMYRIVVAASPSDLDNLLLCTMAKQRDPSMRTVALCNGPVYREIFDHPSVDGTVTDRLEIPAILAAWGVLS